MSLINGTYSNISIAYRGFTNWDYKDRLNPVEVDPFAEEKDFPVNFTGKKGRTEYQQSIVPARNTNVSPTKI